MSASDDNLAAPDLADYKDEKSKINDRSTSRVAVEPIQTLDLFEGTIDPVYEAKARILNDAIQEIGMGKYQVILFVVVA